MEPTISILTPTFNRSATFLTQTIKSIQKQNERGFTHEHIIIDDASTDETEAIVWQYKKEDPRILYYRNERNSGPAFSLNKGFNLSQGKLILPFDDDDLLPPDALQTHYNFMREHTEVDWSLGYACNIDKDNQPTGERERPFFHEESEVFLQALLGRNTITNGTVVIRREALTSIEGWDKDVTCQDWGMWVKLASHHLPVGLNGANVCFYRVHTNQLTTRHSKDGTYEQDGELLRKRYGPYTPWIFQNP